MSELLDNNQSNPTVRRPLLGRILGEKFNLLDSKLEEALAYQQDKGGLARRSLAAFALTAGRTILGGSRATI